MKLKIKKCHRSAVIPSYANEGDCGLDLTATEFFYDHENNCVTYHTGLKVEIPKNHVGLLFPRSSIYKKNLTMSNCVGVIDSGYRGEILVKFNIEGNKLYKEGDRVAQLIVMPYPTIEIEEVFELSESQRGEGGHGSSGE